MVNSIDSEMRIFTRINAPSENACRTVYGASVRGMRFTDNDLKDILGFTPEIVEDMAFMNQVLFFKKYEEGSGAGTGIVWHINEALSLVKDPEQMFSTVYIAVVGMKEDLVKRKLGELEKKILLGDMKADNMKEDTIDAIYKSMASALTSLSLQYLKIRDGKIRV